jgi:type II secretory pathway component PulC
MTPDRRYASLLGRLAAVLPFVAVGLGGRVVYRVRTLPVPVTDAIASTSPASVPPPAVLPASLDWSVFQNEQAPTPAARGALSRRFRLAGTFFAYGSAAGDTRRAVLHDLQAAVQMIIGEGESIGDVKVVRIASDRVILRRGLEEAELWLGFSRADPESSADDPAAAESDADGKESAFGGRKTGEHSWVFRRDALQDYYQDVLDDPERLVRIFDSMKAVRGENRRITGYRLDILGEGDFYRAAGMRQGDIVRKVNGMNMTSRRRAEFFIGEFARNRANVFELEIERNGQPLKLTYQIR